MSHRLLLISMLKSGTNMITQAIGGDHDQIHATFIDKHPLSVVVEELESFTRFGRGHLYYHKDYEQAILSREGTKTVFLYRDPRDMIVSHIHWIKKIFKENDFMGGWINMKTSSGVPLRDADDPITDLIKVYRSHIKRFLPWMIIPWIYLMRYEDLVLYPQEEFEMLVDWMEEPLLSVLGNPTPAAMVNKINPDTCSTYRKGIIGDWRNEFTDKHIKLFNHEMGDILEMLGYE